ncbi:MAG: hypothetical protein ACPLUI_08895, partial [Desulfofundulus sp.]
IRLTISSSFKGRCLSISAALTRCYEHLQEVLRALSAGENLDLVAIDLKAAWEALGEITGTTVAEDIIDRIFRDFCIGK